jgi:thioredoxin 2
MKHLLDERGAIVSCPSCGTANRLAFATLDRQTRCAKCKTTLAAADVPFEAASDAAFEAAASQSAIPLLVDFWAAWCGPCRMVAPELQKVARARAGQWLVVKVDTDALTASAAKYRIQSLPTIAVIHRGQERGRIAGVRPAAEIERFAEGATASRTRRAS